MQQSELQALGQHIQVKLQQLPSPIRLRVRCAFREEALLVLAEHLLHVEPSPRQTFTTISDALQEFTPELMKSGWVRSGIGGTKFLPVRIYLRVAGYQQPYDSFVFSLKPPAPPISTNPPIPTFVPPPVVVAPPEPATFLQVQVEPGIVETEPVLASEPIAEFPLAAEVVPIVEVEPAAEVELTTEQPDLSDNPIAQVAPAVEPEIFAPEIIEAEPVVEVESTTEVEPISTEIEIPEEQTELSDNSAERLDNSIAQVAPAIEPAVEPEIVEPEVIEVEPVSEVEPVAETESSIEVESIREGELSTEMEIPEEQTELSDNPIAEVTPVEIAELDPVIAEAAIDEPVFAESFGAEQLPDLAELIPEEIAELPIAADAEPPTIALEDSLVEPEAIEDFLLLEEISLDPVKEIIPPQEITFVPAAIDPIAGNVALAADETSFTQNEIQDESESDIILLEELIAEELVEEAIEIQDEPESAVDLPEAAIVEAGLIEEAIEIQDEVVEVVVDLPKAAIVEESIEIQDEVEAVVDLPEAAIVEELSQSVTFSQPIPPFSIRTLDTQPTPQSFFPEYSALTDAELTDSANLAELEELETVDEPGIVEVFDLPELDTTSSEPASVYELREPPELRDIPEPENLAIDHVPPSEEIVAADSAIAKKALTDELYTHFDDSTTPISTVSPAPKDSVAPPRQPFRAPQLSSSGIMMGTAIALFGLLGGWYILSRPCVLGNSCEPLQQAQQISQAAFQTVQSTESAIAIAKAYDDLVAANKLLKSIPSWSGQHQAAQALIADNNAKSAVIGQLVRTLRKGNEAANRSQNPPHPLPEWREIQRLWRESIAALEKIPNNTAVYPVAQRKADEYRTNLNGINKRVIVEQQAQEEVDNAKKTAQLAETRTGIATSAEGWRDVYTSWQAAISLLKNVPKGAAARLEAEELLKIYQTKLAAAGTRRDQENAAIAAYTEAIAQSEKAQSFQQKNQWQKAIAAWEDALANVQKVSQGTTPYTQAQPLIATYKTALTQAQGGLRTSEAIQAAKPALDRSCGGKPKVCQYDAAPTAIRVQITYGYDQMVESAMTSAQTKGNSAAQASVVSQVNTFLQELALISQTSQVPIDLYNANGSKFGTYSPNASGFIPQ